MNSYRITTDCISCGDCVPVCSVGAVIEDGLEYRIDPDICIDCGTCEVFCPVNAIVEGS